MSRTFAALLAVLTVACGGGSQEAVTEAVEQLDEAVGRTATAPSGTTGEVRGKVDGQDRIWFTMAAVGQSTSRLFVIERDGAPRRQAGIQAYSAPENIATGETLNLEFLLVEGPGGGWTAGRPGVEYFPRTDRSHLFVYSSRLAGGEAWVKVAEAEAGNGTWRVRGSFAATLPLSSQVETEFPRQRTIRGEFEVRLEEAGSPFG